MRGERHTGFIPPRGTAGNCPIATDHGKVVSGSMLILHVRVHFGEDLVQWSHLSAQGGEACEELGWWSVEGELG